MGLQSADIVTIDLVEDRLHFRVKHRELFYQDLSGGLAVAHRM